MIQPLNFNALQDEGATSSRLALAPLVDIVLLLICFYLLVMNSIQSRTDVQLTLPTMAHHMSDEPLPAELIVNIDPSGAIILNGQPVQRDELLGLLHSQQAQAGRGQTVRVTVRADAKLRFALLDEVMNICRDAGIRMISLRTGPEVLP
jgi:biopolymer transport protein ExbD